MWNFGARFRALDLVAFRHVSATMLVVGLCVFCSLMTVTLASMSSRTSAWNHGLGLTFALVAAVALIWRYRCPRLVLCLSVVGPFFFETDATAALFALYALARSVRGRRLIVPALAVYVACVVSLTYDAHRHRGYSVLTIGAHKDPVTRVTEDYPIAWWIPFLVALFLVSVVLTLGLIVQARSDLSEAVASRDGAAAGQDELREEVIRSQERQRIAREMHDTIAQRLSRISLAAGGLQLNSAGVPAVANSASLIHSSAHEALQDLRGIVGVLRGDAPPRPDASPGATMEGVDGLIAGARRAGLRVLFASDLPPESPGPLAARLAYDTVRECITNAQKYAPDQALRITITGSGADGLLVQARNPRPPDGYAHAPGSGSGLAALATDAAAIGGSLTRSVTAEFRVRVWAPWHS